MLTKSSLSRVTHILVRATYYNKCAEAGMSPGPGCDWLDLLTPMNQVVIHGSHSHPPVPPLPHISKHCAGRSTIHFYLLPVFHSHSQSPTVSASCQLLVPSSQPHDSDDTPLVHHAGYARHHKYQKAIADGFTPIMNLDQNPKVFPVISPYVPTLSQHGGAL